MPRRPLRARQTSAPYLPPALVLDCSVALAWYLEDESTDFTDSLLDAIPKLEIWVPAIWMLEFSNALFAAERRRRISASERAQIVGQASLHLFNVDPHVMSLREVDELADQHNLTPYDVVYFELARRNSRSLPTSRFFRSWKDDRAMATLLEGKDAQRNPERDWSAAAPMSPRAASASSSGRRASR